MRERLRALLLDMCFESGKVNERRLARRASQDLNIVCRILIGARSVLLGTCDDQFPVLRKHDSDRMPLLDMPFILLHALEPHAVARRGRARRMALMHRTSASVVAMAQPAKGVFSHGLQGELLCLSDRGGQGVRGAAHVEHDGVVAVLGDEVCDGAPDVVGAAGLDAVAPRVGVAVEVVRDVLVVEDDLDGVSGERVA